MCCELELSADWRDICSMLDLSTEYVTFKVYLEPQKRDVLKARIEHRRHGTFEARVVRLSCDVFKARVDRPNFPVI